MQFRQQYPVAGELWGIDAHQAAIAVFAQTIQPRFDGGEGRGAGREQPFPGSGEGNAAGAAVKKADTERLFEAGDALAEGGLGQVQLLRAAVKLPQRARGEAVFYEIYG